MLPIVEPTNRPIQTSFFCMTKYKVEKGDRSLKCFDFTVVSRFDSGKGAAPWLQRESGLKVPSLSREGAASIAKFKLRHYRLYFFFGSAVFCFAMTRSDILS